MGMGVFRQVMATPGGTGIVAALVPSTA